MNKDIKFKISKMISESIYKKMIYNLADKCYSNQENDLFEFKNESIFKDLQYETFELVVKDLENNKINFDKLNNNQFVMESLVKFLIYEKNYSELNNILLHGYYKNDELKSFVIKEVFPKLNTEKEDNGKNIYNIGNLEDKKELFEGIIKAGSHKHMNTLSLLDEYTKYVLYSIIYLHKYSDNNNFNKIMQDSFKNYFTSDEILNTKFDLKENILKFLDLKYESHLKTCSFLLESLDYTDYEKYKIIKEMKSVDEIDNLDVLIKNVFKEMKNFDDILENNSKIKIGIDFESCIDISEKSKDDVSIIFSLINDIKASWESNSMPDSTTDNMIKMFKEQFNITTYMHINDFIDVKIKSKSNLKDLTKEEFEKIEFNDKINIENDYSL